MEFRVHGQELSLEEAVAYIQKVLEEPQWIWDAKWQAYFDQQGIPNPHITDARLCPLCSNLGWTLGSTGFQIRPCPCLHDQQLPVLNPNDHGQRQLEAIALAKYGCNYLTIRAEQGQ